LLPNRLACGVMFCCLL